MRALEGLVLTLQIVVLKSILLSLGLVEVTKGCIVSIHMSGGCSTVTIGGSSAFIEGRLIIHRSKTEIVTVLDRPTSIVECSRSGTGSQAV